MKGLSNTGTAGDKASAFADNVRLSATVNIGVSLPGLDNEKTRMIREASGR